MELFIEVTQILFSNTFAFFQALFPHEGVNILSNRQYSYKICGQKQKGFIYDNPLKNFYTCVRFNVSTKVF